jgi:hypothetical protein
MNGIRAEQGEPVFQSPARHLTESGILVRFRGLLQYAGSRFTVDETGGDFDLSCRAIERAIGTAEPSRTWEIPETSSVMPPLTCVTEAPVGDSDHTGWQVPHGLSADPAPNFKHSLPVR